jgi:hypothetical protein
VIPARRCQSWGQERCYDLGALPNFWRRVSAKRNVDASIISVGLAWPDVGKTEPPAT